MWQCDAVHAVHEAGDNELRAMEVAMDNFSSTGESSWDRIFKHLDKLNAGIIELGDLVKKKQ